RRGSPLWIVLSVLLCLGESKGRRERRTQSGDPRRTSKTVPAGVCIPRDVASSERMTPRDGESAHVGFACCQRFHLRPHTSEWRQDLPCNGRDSLNAGCSCGGATRGTRFATAETDRAVQHRGAGGCRCLWASLPRL